MVLSPGTRLGPYEIQALIGTGGMGEVYKARDSRLNRTVAIKRIAKTHAERFETEARAIAALNHPHICQIYDVGPDYLVLEYLEGEPLRGPLGPEDAVRLAIQIASALEAAHERGVLHRDLKPANVMVLGHGKQATIKLLDFGVARLMSSDPSVTRTDANDAVGTPAYMSPEQAQRRPLDARSDVFSFGAVLYELLAGARAFPGDSIAEVLGAVLRDEPPAVDAPTTLQHIIRRCLAKDPELRFQSMVELKQALQRATFERGDRQASIAVLPFVNLSAEKENEYFADGLAEEIINALVQAGGLRVIARTSAFAFKGRNEDVRHIAQALGVTNVLEGSVRRAGDRIRVTAQLIAAADGAHLWSERFDRPMTDVFEMQDEISRAITAALKGRLREASGKARSHTPPLDAYDRFLQGRALLTHFTPESWNRARIHFEQAIAIDPHYGDAHAELALGQFLMGMHGMRPMREIVPFVREAVDRALQLNPSDPRPRFLLGAVALCHDYDWPGAEAHFAASMNATEVSIHARWIWASLYLRGLGRFEESADEMARVVEQDPLNATWQAIWSTHLQDAGRIDQAVRVAERAVELEPNYGVAEQRLGEAYWASGRTAEALAAFERTYALAPWNSFAAGRLAAALHENGEIARADALMRQMGDGPQHASGQLAYAFWTSDIDAAAVWFERMIEQRNPFALMYARAPGTRPLREHHSWPRLAAMMKLP